MVNMQIKHSETAIAVINGLSWQEAVAIARESDGQCTIITSWGQRVPYERVGL